MESIIDGSPRSFPFQKIELFTEGDPLPHFPRLLFTSVAALVFIGCVAVAAVSCRGSRTLQASRSFSFG